MSFNFYLIITSATVSAGIASLITFINEWFRRNSEERKHQRELILKASIESWKVQNAFCEPRHLPALPLDAFIIHNTLLLEALLKKKITAQNISEILTEIQKVTSTASDHIREYSKDLRK